MAMPRFNVEFTKNGKIHDQDEVDALLTGIDGITDLIVVSHGWNNDIADATALYDELLGNVDKLLDARDNPQAPDPLKAIAGRTYAACQVFWPSKKFTEEELIPGGGAASAQGRQENDEALLKALDNLAEDSERLGNDDTPGERKQLAEDAKGLVARLDDDAAARSRFVAILRELLDPEDAAGDDASEEFFTADPEILFQKFEIEVVAPPPVSGGGATGVSDGGAAGIRDMIRGAKAAARRLANFATYYKMKSRAGKVGSSGAASVIRQVRETSPAIKVHLVGHSFGGRLVTAAAHALDDNTPDVSMSLLQAAFSHNGFSANFDDGKPGFYREVVSKKRASGPIFITHTKNDRAVGIAYPLASRIAFQKASALGDANDPYGGMGRNGAQRTTEVDAAEKKLMQVGHTYDGFSQGAIYNLLADEFIGDHGDVRGPQVAYAILCATGKL